MTEPNVEILPPQRDARGQFIAGHGGAKPKGARQQIAQMCSQHLLDRMESDGKKASPVHYLVDVMSDEALPHPIRIQAAGALLRNLLPKDFKISMDTGEPRDIRIAVQVVENTINQYLGKESPNAAG